MRALIMSAALVFAARSAWAQDPLSAAKKAAQNAVAATNAHTEAMQRPEGVPQKTAPKAPAPTAEQSKAAAPAPKVTAPTKGAAKTTGGKTQQQAGQLQAPGTQLNVATTDTAGPPPSILREVFEYPRDGRRDPFVSLLTTAELRPTMSDLKLVSTLIDHSGRNSIAILRDLSNNTQYRAHVGSTLGRMRVTSIHGGTVLLTIDEFGTTRQDSLVLRDSTKVRKP